MWHDKDPSFLLKGHKRLICNYDVSISIAISRGFPAELGKHPNGMTITPLKVTNLKRFTCSDCNYRMQDNNAQWFHGKIQHTINLPPCLKVYTSDNVNTFEGCFPSSVGKPQESPYRMRRKDNIQCTMKQNVPLWCMYRIHNHFASWHNLSCI